MSDQSGAPEQQPGTSADAGTQPGVDYERQYNELRPEYTRATQRLSEYEGLFEALHDPETQAEALAALGFDLDAGATPQETQRAADEFVDPLEEEMTRLRAQVEELTSTQEQQREREQQENLLAMRDDYIAEAIGFIEQSTKEKFSDAEEEVLGNLAIAMSGDDGVPDVQGAYNRIYGESGVLETRRQSWIDSKQGANPAPFGTTIPADQKPKSARERVAFIDERVRAQEQSY